MPRWVRRALDTAAWLVLVPMLALSMTQWFGIEGRRTITAFQALTPWVLVWSAPLALVASLCRRHVLALVALLPLATLLVLTQPVVFHAGAPAAAGATPRLTVAYANVLYNNPAPEAVADALLATDADVLVMAEFVNPVQQALEARAGDDYPYRAEAVSRSSSAIGIWSRHPIVSGGVTRVGGRATIDVVLDVDGHEVRVLGVHPNPPTFDADLWEQQLAAIGDHATVGELPTVIVGDFNAARWHPSFRALLDRGWRDVHETMGRGWSVSWPMDEGLLPPPFVRIDHALFGDGVAPIAIDDLAIPGSDHKGFVVTFGLTDAAVRA
ncbi:MAG: endonuclease/exonuclease/phosphatase family protein [Actinomycetota bacterium]|nr:endonuclease/exonuclease/phosphatase family protein [Actinomycetota bacterium]